MNTLQNVINDRFVKLGDTPEGAAWAMAALHPAGGTLELRGIPDADAFPSVCMDYETVVSIPPPVGAQASWSATISMLGHPIQPCSVLTQASGVAVGYVGVTNPTIVATSSYSDYTVGFAGLCNSYRMLYCGLTADLDASALNDSGSVVAGQFPLESQVFNYSATGTSGTAQCHVLNTNYRTNFPGSAISQLPGAYMGLAKDGIYMPLKLDPQSPWVSTAMGQLVATSSLGTAVALSQASLTSYTLSTAVAPAGVSFPFYGSTAYGNPYPLRPANLTAASAAAGGDVVVALQQQSVGHCYFYNLSPSASLTLKLRWGVELRVEPTSMLAPALKPSARHDSLALSAYSDLAGSLPWAYPSSYNSEGKLAAVIKRAWNMIKPAAATVMGAIPHPAAQAGSAMLKALPAFERPAGTGTTVAKAAPARPKPVLSRTSTTSRLKRR